MDGISIAVPLPGSWPGSEKAVAVSSGPAAAAEVPSDSGRLDELMAGYQRGDARAVTELVEQLSPKLLRFLAGPLQTRAHAEDMLQECWLRIHKARHTYRPSTPVLPWVFAIARYTRVDVYRRRRRIDEREQALEDTGSLQAASETQSYGSEQDLWRLVAQLPPSQQEVLKMLKVLGMSLEEVARATGTSVGAVKQKAHRAYEKLRVLLREAGLRETGPVKRP